MTFVVILVLLVGCALVWLVIRSVGSSGAASNPRPQADPDEDPNDLSVDDMVLMDMLDDDLDG